MATPFDAPPPGAAKSPRPHSYNAPPGSLENPPSTVGEQIRTDYFNRKALVEASKEAFFGQMADTTNMPKNMGKTIKQYLYVPILDDRNVNDQGIDAAGVAFGADTTVAGNWVDGISTTTVTLALTAPEDEARRNFYAKFYTTAWESQGRPGLDGDGTDPLGARPLYDHDGLPEKLYFSATETGGSQSAAAGIARQKVAGQAIAWMNNFLGAGLDPTAAGAALADEAAIVGVLGATVQASTGTNTALWTAEIIADGTSDAGDGYGVSGNLYGSSKDIGTIAGKMPVLSETGGRVNRVGMTRLTLEASLEKFGFFEEYTQESLDFDSDPELLMHITQEAVKAANEVTEDQLQIDLLHAAGVIRYTGEATSMASLSGVDDSGRARDAVGYDDLVKLGIELDNNRTPKNTKVITGSRMIDTRVVNAARYMYIGSELIPSIMRMTDYHGEKAFIPVAQYGAATTIAKGELGAVHDFRFIVVPEMMHWEGAGADATCTSDLAMTGVNSDGDDKFNVYPMLCVGDGAFTTVGFQTSGRNVKFTITHKKPGKEVADRHDPYGEVGFYSIKWYYGFMVQRPERIALLKTVAEY